MELRGFEKANAGDLKGLFSLPSASQEAMKKLAENAESDRESEDLFGAENSPKGEEEEEDENLF